MLPLTVHECALAIEPASNRFTSHDHRTGTSRYRTTHRFGIGPGTLFTGPVRVTGPVQAQDGSGPVHGPVLLVPCCKGRASVISGSLFSSGLRTQDSRFRLFASSRTSKLDYSTRKFDVFYRVLRTFESAMFDFRPGNSTDIRISLMKHYNHDYNTLSLPPLLRYFTRDAHVHAHAPAHSHSDASGIRALAVMFRGKLPCRP